MYYALEVAYGLYLGLISIMDIRSKTIPLKWLLCGTIFIPAYFLTGEAGELKTKVLGTIPGAVLMLISVASRGQIGMADAVLIMIMGACIGIGRVISVISISFMAIAAVSMVMLIAGKLNRKSTLPYIPFVLLGYTASAVLI